jgi:hypothetical protein
LLREESGAIWVVYGRAKFGVPDPKTYNRLFSRTVLRQLWDGALAAIGDAPVDGTLLRDDGGGIWVIYGGAKFGVPDVPTYDRLFSRTVLHQLWDGALDQIGTVPVDGTLLREESSTQVYRIVGGKKRATTALPRQVHILWDGALNQIP